MKLKVKLREKVEFLKSLQWKLVSYQGKAFSLYCYCYPKGEPDALINRTLTLESSAFWTTNHPQCEPLSNLGLSPEVMEQIELEYLKALL